MATMHDRLCAALRRAGYHDLPSIQNSRKYRVFKRPDGAFYYVGKQGALRAGSSISGSVSISDAFKKQFLATWEAK